MEALQPILILAGGFLFALLSRMGKRSRGNDGSGDIDGIEAESRVQREINIAEGNLIDDEKRSLAEERRQLANERAVIDRDRDLLAELEKRAREKAQQ